MSRSSLGVGFVGVAYMLAILCVLFAKEYWGLAALILTGALALLGLTLILVPPLKNIWPDNLRSNKTGGYTNDKEQ